MPNGAELFVRTAARLGIDTVFTLVGDHLNEVLAAAAREGLRIVEMRHESAVAHAADAWTRIHPGPALSLVTGGPGATTPDGDWSANCNPRRPAARIPSPASCRRRVTTWSCRPSAPALPSRNGRSPGRRSKIEQSPGK